MLTLCDISHKSSSDGAHSRLRAGARGHRVVPTAQMAAVVGNAELDPAGEVDGHESGDVGDRVSVSGDEFAVRQAGVHHREEFAQAGTPALGERGDLLVI